MSERQNQYNIGLDKTPANYVPLSPLSFLARSAAVYPDHVSTVYEGRSFTWAQTYARCRRFASWLAAQRHRRRRHGRGDAAEHSRDERGTFRRADVRCGAERAQHPARCADDRFHARSWRRQDRC